MLLPMRPNPLCHLYRRFGENILPCPSNYIVPLEIFSKNFKAFLQQNKYTLTKHMLTLILMLLQPQFSLNFFLENKCLCLLTKLEMSNCNVGISDWIYILCIRTKNLKKLPLTRNKHSPILLATCARMVSRESMGRNYTGFMHPKWYAHVTELTQWNVLILTIERPRGRLQALARSFLSSFFSFYIFPSF